MLFFTFKNHHSSSLLFNFWRPRPRCFAVKSILVFRVSLLHLLVILAVQLLVPVLKSNAVLGLQLFLPLSRPRVDQQLPEGRVKDFRLFLSDFRIAFHDSIQEFGFGKSKNLHSAFEGTQNLRIDFSVRV
jgi:hypothetical protein